MGNVFFFFFPLLWMAVSVIVALILYKTSDGLFQRIDATGERKTQIRLTGSVVIACSVFLLIWKVTPSLSSEVQKSNKEAALQAQIDNLKAAAVTSQSNLVELRNCVSDNNASECLPIIEKIEDNLATGSIGSGTGHNAQKDK